MLAKNAGTEAATVPAFTLAGVSKQDAYTGSRVNHDAVTLQPGQQQYLFYAIPVPNNTLFQRLVLLTPEQFARSGADGSLTASTFDLGRIAIQLKTKEVPSLPYQQFSAPIAFDPLDHLIDRQESVSLEEFNRTSNEEEGYNTVIAKFALKNGSDHPLAIPPFQVEIISPDGSRYRGERQRTNLSQLSPHMIQTVSYAFNIPSSNTSTSYTMKLLDGAIARPYTSSIAAFRVSTQPQGSDSELKLYPYDIQLKHWTINSVSSPAQPGQTNYKMYVDLDIQKARDVRITPSFSTIQMVFKDQDGRRLAETMLPLTGQGQLMNGYQNIMLSGLRPNGAPFPSTIEFHEVIQTAGGSAERLITTLKP